MDTVRSLDQPHLLEHGSVEDEYENRLLHSDVSFRNDNGTLLGYLKESTNGTIFAYPIKTYNVIVILVQLGWL